MTLTSDLIPAKLARPRVRRGFIERASLIARLDEGLEGRVTLISAPAGYGKSTLIAQWVEQPSAPRTAWVSLDSLDSDLERFSKYLVAALRQLDPDCLALTEGLLSAQNLPPPEYLAETMAAELGGLEGRVVLVLDDYGVIRGEAVHALMQRLVHRLPDALHLVFLSRIDPPLPLNLWRTRFWLHELRGTDLRFSREEARAFFEAADAVRLSDAAIDVLHRKTEGWVTGLRLALLSLAESADAEERVRAFSGSERLIVDYLMEQALAVQPPEIREFLALTAPLERFCAPLCDHLLTDHRSRPDSRQVLERLYRDNLFLIPLDTTRGWYRYHHLFRQLLLDRFDELAPASSQAEISRQAGEWFAREGWIEEGLKYLLAAGDLDGAADLVADHLHDVIKRDLSRRTLARWLSMFPAGAERGRLPLIVSTLYMMILRWDFDGMLRLLDEAETTCRDLDGERYRRWWQELRPDLDALRGYALYWSGDIPGTVEHMARAMTASPDPGSYQHSLALLYYGAGVACAGRRLDFANFLDEGLTRERAAGGPQVGPYLVAKSCIHLYWAELDMCRDAALRMVPAGAHVVIPKYWQGIAYYLMGAVAYERGLLDEAEAHFREGETMRFDTSPMFNHHLLLGLARVRLARGDYDGAQHWAAAARDFALEAASPTALRDSEWFDRQLALAGRQAATAEPQPPTVPDFMRLSLDAPFQTWAWLQLNDPTKDGWETTLRLIDEAIGRAEANGIERQAIQLSILRAIALDRLGQGEQAVEELEDTVRRAEPHGFVRSFLDRGSSVRKLLRAVATRNPGDAYVEKLLEAFDTPPGHIAPGVTRGETATSPTESTAAKADRDAFRRRLAPWQSLTNREFEVLELLEQRLSNKEIAARLFVTPETVRKHTLSIYRKLGVSDRRQAVAEALARGVLG